MNEDKGTRYRRAERTLRACEVAVATVVLCGVAISPLPRSLRLLGHALSDSSRGPFAAFATEAGIAAAILAVSVALPMLAALPLALRRLGGLARRYGLPGTTWRAYVRERVPRGLLLTAGGASGWWVFARLASQAPWLAGVAASALALAVASVVMLLAPWLILLSPRVRPLRDEAVTGRLHALASRAQLRLAGLHEWVIGAHHGEHANAALVGVIGPRRLLISDTLIAGCPLEEMDAVVAHELGHHAHGHTWQRVRSQATTLVLAVLAAQASAAGPARWLGGTAGLTDPASLPWMLLGAGAVWLVTRPWQLALSRAHEAEADAFALALTGRPDVLERVLMRIGTRNLSSDDDSWLTRAFFLTHPPIPARIAAARRAASAAPAASS